jgi:5'-deoxynucleotidase YfbR-like HD superfamily hydrolase
VSATYPIFAAEHEFDFARPDLADLTVDECATSLGRLFRWRGAIPISVGQHSVVLARHAKNEDVSRWLLLHDVPEILLGDLPSPLKALTALEPYRRAEERMMLAVVERFDLPTPEPPAVRKYDVRIRRDEVAQHLPHAIDAVKHLRPLGVELDPWMAARARREFVAEAKNLGVS